MDRFGRISGGNGPCLLNPKVSMKSSVLLNTPGTHFGIIKTILSKSGIVWLTVPRNDLFILEDGFYGCLR